MKKGNKTVVMFMVDDDKYNKWNKYIQEYRGINDFEDFDKFMIHCVEQEMLRVFYGQAPLPNDIDLVHKYVDKVLKDPNHMKNPEFIGEVEGMDENELKELVVDMMVENDRNSRVLERLVSTLEKAQELVNDNF